MREQYVKVEVPRIAVRDTTSPSPATTTQADVEAQLDEALQMTFPASDPISVSAHR